MGISARQRVVRGKLQALPRAEKERVYTQFHAAVLAAEADKLPEQAERYRSLLKELAAVLEFTPQEVRGIEEASTLRYREVERLITSLLHAQPELPLPEQQLGSAH